MVAFSWYPSGSVMVKFWVVELPHSLVIVQVYVPAAKPLAVAFDPPLGDQAYVKDVPPEATTVAEPFVAPLQVAFV